MPSVGDITAIVNEFVQSDEGKEVVAEQGYGFIGGRPRREVAAEYEKIAESFLKDVQIAYASVLTRSSSKEHPGTSLLSYGMFRTMELYDIKISNAKGTVEINITLPSDLLYRPSLEGFEYGYNNYVSEYMVGKRRKKMIVSQRAKKRTGKFTGSGIDDIFALISQGYKNHGSARINARGLRGLWDGNPGGGDRITYALPQRQGTPFVPDVAAKYEMMYPGLVINYPPEWG